MTYKIVKEIHTYQKDSVKFRIQERFLWKWIPSPNFSGYDTYELAEKAIVDKLNGKHGGIIEVSDNVYKFIPYSLPLP
jgi:hypothetical protein